MKTTITILLALALTACTDDVGQGDDAGITTTDAPLESSSDDSSSDDGSSSDAGDELGTTDDGDSSSDDGSSSSDTTGAGECASVSYVDGEGLARTCCCTGGDPEDACPDALPWCECATPSTLPEHAACGSSCDATCAIGLSCRESYAGGYLAECAAPCSEDVDCDTVGDVCSAGWCVTPCGPEGECADGTFCYPPPEGPDPVHPLPHCMPQEAT